MSEQPLNPESGSKSGPQKEKPAKPKIPPTRKEIKEPALEHSEGEAPASLPIRPRTAVTKREHTDEESISEEESKEKDKAPTRMKPSGKPFSIHAKTKEKDASEENEKKEAQEEVLDKTESVVEGVAEETKSVPFSSHIPEKKRPSLLGRILRIQIPLIPALAVLILVGAMIGLHYYNDGIVEGKREAELALEKEVPPLPPELITKLDAAFLNLRNGHAPEALKVLSEIESTNTYPSMAYMVALAALQSGDIDLVEEKARASIRKREKISDSLALLAVVESQRANDKTRVKMGSSIKRSEGLLAQAIAADPSNPYPRFELATLLRYDRRKEEAAVQLNGARSLLNPIDSHSIMDITSNIMRLEVMPVDQIPSKSEPSDNPQKLIPAAYAAMRLGDFAQAATLLRAARDVLSAESFDYLVNDPALRRYAREAQLAEFYGN